MAVFEDPCGVLTVHFAVNIRNKITPPLPHGFVGNTVVTACASAKVVDLNKESLEFFVEKVKEAIEMVTDEYVKSVVDWLEVYRGVPSTLDENFYVSAWWKLPFHELDFGYGRPTYGGLVVSGMDEFVLLLSDGIGVRRGGGVNKQLPKISPVYFAWCNVQILSLGFGLRCITISVCSLQGLRYHLTTSHDLFNYEFWLTEEYEAVNVSVKTDIGRSESVADGVDPRLQTFSFYSKPCRYRTLKKLVQNAKHVHPHARNSASPEVSREASHEGHLEKDAGTNSYCKPITTSSKDAEPSNRLFLQRFEKDGGSNKDKEHKILKAFFIENHLERHKAKCCGLGWAAEVTEAIASSSNVTGFCSTAAQASASNECVQPISTNYLAPSSMLQFVKTRKLSANRADPRK
ncbi:uncharacterized protein LOC131245871 [Magnolia sinica]|uniref:uncharacterized protein LOC131245871 n=1 Tax=Magnolia sinica TaxID=86752 RepID=UPI002657D21E|nr:uncharacterized protein LOC131245871 [Magnolia sinica]